MTSGYAFLRVLSNLVDIKLKLIDSKNSEKTWKLYFWFSAGVFQLPRISGTLRGGFTALQNFRNVARGFNGSPESQERCAGVLWLSRISGSLRGGFTALQNFWNVARGCFGQWCRDVSLTEAQSSLSLPKRNLLRL